ncbi:MAG: Albonoursin synthase [Actinobacteria bacterium ADurb.Bin346]|nr:MAG: Albonoursin synthase [Actinobacteria bacterium ADurb.Bin346]
MKEIFERRSIRKYAEKDVPDWMITELLKAAMSAPSAGNEQPWEFIIIKEKSTLDKISRFHPYAQMLPDASAAIVVLGDLDKEKHPGYWVQDCAAAVENMLIEAQYLELGAVWLGIYPREERVDNLKKLLGVPEKIIPLAIISLGFPAENKSPSVERYDEKRVHLEKW